MLMILSASKNEAAANVQDAAQYPIDLTELRLTVADQSKEDGASAKSLLLLLDMAFKLVAAMFVLVDCILVALISEFH